MELKLIEVYGAPMSTYEDEESKTSYEGPMQNKQRKARIE